MNVRNFFYCVIAGLLCAACEQATNGNQAAQDTDLDEVQDDEDVPVYERLAAIEVASAPDITYYALGQAFDTSGLVVNGVYYRYIGYDEAPGADVEPDEVFTLTLDPSAYTVTAPDTSTDGGRFDDVIVKCGELPQKTVLIYISNSSLALNAVKLKSLPTKNTYELGEDFSKTGLTITGSYSDGSERDLSGSMCQVLGYDKRKRGSQTVTLRLNGKPVAEIPVTVKAPASAVVTANDIHNIEGYMAWKPGMTEYYRNVYIKGMPMTLENSGLRLNAKSHGETITLTRAGGGITDTDTISDYDYNTAGLKYPKLRIDEAEVALELYCIDAEPELYFDYGFMRHNKDTGGKGHGAGKYYVKQGSSLVLSPIRFLIGFDENNNDIGVTSCVWKVDGAEKQGGTTETFTFTPSTVGTYTVSVSVTGRNFVTGGSVTKDASTEVVCFTGTVSGSSGKPLTAPLKNFTPGQFTKGGAGYGWSLGTGGGYEMWPVSSQAITIMGNGFEGWNEPGIVWLQADENGNNIPDEMWYEVTGGGELYNGKPNVTRRWAIKHVAYEGSTAVTEYGQPVGRIFWADSMGLCGEIITGWPDDWGVDPAVPGVWVMYTGTILHTIPTDRSNYVDCFQASQTMTVNASKAVRADGSPANIGNNIRFVKVQTGVFIYGTAYGDYSTEIVRATGIDGDQSGGFPNPLGSKQ